MENITIHVYSNRKLSRKSVDIGNMQENKVTKLIFELDEGITALGGNAYLVVSYDGESYPYPLRNNTFTIGRELTQRKKTEANIIVSTSGDEADPLNGVVWISNTLILLVDKNSINIDTINEQELPPSLKLVYDDLLKLEKEIANFDFIKIVTELPTQGLPNRTYLVAKSDMENNDLYDEYLWVNDKWEFVGTKTIEVDLTNYVTKEYADSNFVTKPTTAEVGQMLVVKAVDENGVPTEWEVSNVATKGTIQDGLYINNGLKGKVIAVIGDSISTQKNKNAAEITISEYDVGVELSAYPTIYDVQNGLTIGGHVFTSDEIGTEVSFTPVSDDVGKVIGLPVNYNTSVDKTWWEVVEEVFECTVIPVCWSGSSVSSHESSSNKYKCSYAWHESQIRKLGVRIEGSMERVSPDIVIIYRGCNDMTHAPYSKLTDGYFDSVDWQYPTSDVVDGGYGFKEAMSLTIKAIRETYPNAQIMLATQNVFKRVNCSHFPTNNGLYTLPQFNKAIREVANFFGCQTIDFDKDGITFENCYTEGYITDSSEIPTHPSTKGHYVMGLQAVKDLTEKYNYNDSKYVEKDSTESTEPSEPTETPYVEIPYLQSSGSQYIDTNYSITSANIGKISYEIDVECDDFSQATSLPNGRVCGVGDGLQLRLGLTYNGTVGNLDWYYGHDYIGASVAQGGGLFKSELNEFYVNGELVDTCDTHTNGNINKTFTIFAYNSGSSIQITKLPLKIKSFKLWDDGVLVRDMLPMKNGSVIGMYDSVTKTFFTNSGTDVFIAG